MRAKELIVVGGGLVGAAIAYGASRSGAAVTMLDQGDVAHRASLGNFGLVWVQGKGTKSPSYARWTRDGVKLWPALARELLELTNVDVGLRQPGGFWIGFTDADVMAREAMLSKIHATVGEVPFEMLDYTALKALLPAIGPTVVGGSYGPLDGHVNPLKLLLALHAGLRARGARVVSGVEITHIRCREPGSAFEVKGQDGQVWPAQRVVLAAGLGNKDLAEQIGLNAPVFPKRGQVLITERLKPFLSYPTNKARQTEEGSVQLGSTTEEVGLDDNTTVSAIESLAKRAVATFPALSSVRLVRAWGSLRVMTSDGLPIYHESPSCPGAFVATSHSGVTLAAAHAFVIGPWMAGQGVAPDVASDFSGDRFLASTRSPENAH